MPKLLVDFTKEQFKGLQRLSHDTGISMNEYVRGFVSDGLHGNPIGSVVLSGGIVASGSILVLRVGKT